MIRGPEQPIKAQITITALYEDCIRISVFDTASGLEFIHMELTREQFVNAAMNRLGNCDVDKAVVRSLDLVGKKRESDTMEFKLRDVKPYGDNRPHAIEEALRLCPEGWEPDLSFSSRGSIFKKDGEDWARTTIRRWV